MTNYSKKSDEQLLKIWDNLRRQLLTIENIDIIDKFEDVIKEQAKRSMKEYGLV